MTTRRLFLVVAVVVAASNGLGGVFVYRAAPAALPDRLANQEFWKISSDLSELSGFFRSDNLLSNEVFLQYVVPELTRTAKPGRVYLGVGPEQNFTYIAALKPAMAFIIDVRRGNLDLHLMYKALFEMSTDRADFVSRLFSRKRPEGLTTSSSIADIVRAFEHAEPSEALYHENLQAIERRLTRTHGFALSSDDLGGAKGLEFIYKAFFTFGPELTYSSINGFGGFGGGRAMPTYADLMTLTDEDGQARGYLASEANFSVVKDLESRNLVVPVVGNFGGPKAIRAVAAYLKEHQSIVSAFLSVERRAISAAGRDLVRLLPQRRDAADRRRKPVHSIDPRRTQWRLRQPEQRARADCGRRQELRPAVDDRNTLAYVILPAMLNKRFHARAVVVSAAAACAFAAFGPLQLRAQPFAPDLLGGFHWRMLGPFRGGRVDAVSGVPGRPHEFYFGSVNGGVWKTVNAGRTWMPVFDSQPVASIGALAVAPSSPDVVYVGSGESSLRDSVGFGNGMYKSTDAGKSWTHIGLTDTQHIGKVAVDPRNANTVFVAAIGHFYGPHPDRGVFRSKDGGSDMAEGALQDRQRRRDRCRDRSGQPADRLREPLEHPSSTMVRVRAIQWTRRRYLQIDRRRHDMESVDQRSSDRRRRSQRPCHLAEQSRRSCTQ